MVFRVCRRMLGVVICAAALHVVTLHAQPKARRSVITIKQLGVVGSNTVRLKHDPVSGRLYLVQNNGLIQRVNFGIGGTATFTTVYTPSRSTA